MLKLKRTEKSKHTKQGKEYVKGGVWHDKVDRSCSPGNGKMEWDDSGAVTQGCKVELLKIVTNRVV